MSNFPMSNWTFVDQATAITNGNPLIIRSGMVTANIYITGTITASTCVFEGADDDENWYAIQCANLTTLTTATQTTGINEVWQVDLTGFFKFRVRISAITAGEGESITIKAKAVD